MTDETPFAQPQQPTPPPVAPVRLTANGFTLEFDLPALLGAIDDQPTYDEVHEEWVPNPTSLRDAITSAAARRLADDMRVEVRATINATVTDVIRDEVATIVRDAMTAGTLQRTNEFGSRLGDPKPLTELIIDTARDVINKPIGDSYSRGGRTTLIQKIVADEVGAAFKRDLQTEVAQAREAAKAAIQTSAAEVIKETIERATRGL